MAQAIPLMFGDVGSPLSNLILATDAMGSSRLDAGGYGIVARLLSPQEGLEILTKCHAVARTIADLSGEVNRWNPPRHLFIGLEDNMPTSGACGKGHSPSHPLNWLCRRKAARTLVGNLRWVSPWVQSIVMPADELSRRLEALQPEGPLPLLAGGARPSL